MRDLFGLLVWLVMGMTLSETEALGFAERVRQLLEEARKALVKAGWDVDLVLSGLKKHYDATLLASETQEALKRSAMNATDTYVAMKRQLYVMSSGYLDMAIAAVGKDTDAAKNMRRYRSEIYRHRPDDETPPTQPGPAPAEPGPDQLQH